MAASLIRTVQIDEDDPDRPAVAGRIVTTVPKAKELRPYVERLVTMARKAIPHQEAAEEFATSADRNTPEWKQWRESEQWQKWNQAMAPAVDLRRRAFSLLRDKDALEILFDELADRFRDRPGGYTRVVRLATRRLGDAGEQALIEFVGDGDRDRVKKKREAPKVVASESSQPTEDETATTVEDAPPGDEEQTEGEPAEAEASVDEEDEAKTEE